MGLKSVIAFATVLVVGVAGLVAVSYHRGYDAVCDVRDTYSAHASKSADVPVPGKIKSAVLCYYHYPVGAGLGATKSVIQSINLAQPVRLANEFNQSKVSHSFTCLIGVNYAFTFVFRTSTGRRIFVRDVTCGPLISNASSEAFDRAPAVQRHIAQIEKPYLPDLGL